MTETKTTETMACKSCSKDTLHEVETNEYTKNVMNTCMVCGSGHGTLHMGAGEGLGDLLTEMARQKAWNEFDKDGARTLLIGSLSDFHIGHADSVISGTHKLVTKDFGHIELVEDGTWAPPYRKIDDADKFINETLSYIDFPGYGAGRSPTGGTWFSHLPERIQLKLHIMARTIIKLRQRNLWEAHDMAIFLRQWSEEMMTKNAVRYGSGLTPEEEFEFVMEGREYANRNYENYDSDLRDSIEEIHRPSDTPVDVLEELKAETMARIAVSGMPAEMKERMLRVADGQLDAYAGKVRIKEDPEFEYDTGWLSPDGKYYGCKPGQHITLSEQLYEANYDEKPGTFGIENALEQDCWVKCTGKKWFYVGNEKLNPKQIDVIRGWAKKWGEPIWWNGDKRMVAEIAKYRGDI